MIKDPSNWRYMSGRTEIVKKINSYLTSKFLASEDAPVAADECLFEAITCVDIVKENESDVMFLLADYLHDQFYNGEKSLFDRIHLCYDPAKDIINMVKNQS